MRPGRSIRGLLLVLAVATLGAGLFSVVGVERPTPPTSGGSSGGPKGELTVGYPDEPASLNPYSFEGDAIATRDLLRPVLPTLLSIAPDLSYRPGLTRVVPSGKDVGGTPFSVRFRLDPKANWSDGHAITAEDIRFTWETIRSPGFPAADRRPYELIRDVVVEGPRTVRLVFDRPYRAWRDLFSAGDFVLPKHFLEGKDIANELAKGISLSGGPYLLESWTRGLQVQYRSNPRWWGEGPRVERIKVLFVPDTEIALRLLEDERTQVIASSTRLNLGARFGAIEGVVTKSRYGSAWWELGFNHQRPFVRDRAVRDSIAGTVAREGIVEALIQNDGRALQDLAPGRSRGNAFGRFNGVPDKPLSTKQDQVILSVPGGNGAAGVLAHTIEKNLSDAGLDIEVRSPDSADFYATWRRDGLFDLALWERRGSNAMDLGSSYSSTLAPPTGVNYSRVKSAAADAALLEDQTVGGSETRKRLMEILAGEIPALPIFEAKAYIGYRSYLAGPSPNPSIDGPFWNLHQWRRVPS